MKVLYTKEAISHFEVVKIAPIKNKIKFSSYLRKIRREWLQVIIEEGLPNI
jgi:hypothetical protein